jgi:phenylacetate-CoA ligase
VFTIRGENIYPSEIDAALNQLPNYGGEHRIVITRDTAMDELLLRVEADDATHRAGAGSVEAFRGEVARKLQTVLGIRTRVEIVAPHSITRTDFKARRVIDDREVFRGLNDQLAREGR